MTTQANEDRAIRRALRILEARLQTEPRESILSQKTAESFLVMKLAQKKSEVFAVMFLSIHHQLIEYREMFNGTIDQTTVYVREIVRAVIETNAGAIVLAHNHPSQLAIASDADRGITMRVQRAMALIDVRVIDHIIVAGRQTVSFAELGYL